MAVTGKIWSAVLYRGPHTTDLTQLQTILVYNGFLTNPTQIQSLYPSLSWDLAAETDDAGLRGVWLPQQDPNKVAVLPYANDEAAIVDMPNYNLTYNDLGKSVILNGNFANWFFMRYRAGAWQTEFSSYPYAGDPSLVSSYYPDANTYNINTAAPFGTGLGNGLIRHQALYYYYGDPPGPGPVYAWPIDDAPAVSDTGNISVFAFDQTYIFTPVEDESGNSLLDGGGDGSTASDSLTIRSWGFSLDGHDFYVLRLGDSGSFIYDLTTQTWSEWISPGRTNWRPHVGQNWKGFANIDTDNGYTDVVCGDDATGTIWVLNTKKGRDERDTAGTIWPDDKITKVVTGGIQVTGRDTVKCGAVELDLAIGNPTQTGALIQLEISDDLGHTFVDCGINTVAAGNYNQPVEWRSLGTISAPGRIFRITDDGMSERIGGANLR